MVDIERPFARMHGKWPMADRYIVHCPVSAALHYTFHEFSYETSDQDASSDTGVLALACNVKSSDVTRLTWRLYMYVHYFYTPMLLVFDK